LLFITFQGPIYNTFGKNIIAVVIDEDAYVKNSFITKENIYKYQFVVEDKTYKGDSQCNKFKIGDSLLIRYLNFYPNKNQPLWILENKECK